MRTRLLVVLMVGATGTAGAQSLGCPPGDSTLVGRVQASQAFRRAQESVVAHWFAIDSAMSGGRPDTAGVFQIANRLCSEISVWRTESVPGLRLAEALVHPGYVARYAMFAITADTVFLLNPTPTGRLSDRLNVPTWNAVVARVPGGFEIDSAERARDYATWLASLIREFVFPFSCPGSDGTPSVSLGATWVATFEFCRFGKPPAQRWLTLEVRESGEVLSMHYDRLDSQQ